MNIFETLTFVEQIEYFGPRILMATLCGGLIGIDRELRNKVAGLRTNILICVGTAIFTALGFLVTEEMKKQGIVGNYDPQRILGQIITGIGFLGAGVIFKDSKGRSVGITTAAYIWVNCAIGMLIGLGAYLMPLAVTLGMLSIMLIVEAIDNFVLNGAKKVLSPVKKYKKEETEEGGES